MQRKEAASSQVYRNERLAIRLALILWVHFDSALSAPPQVCARAFSAGRRALGGPPSLGRNERSQRQPLASQSFGGRHVGRGRIHLVKRSSRGGSEGSAPWRVRSVTLDVRPDPRNTGRATRHPSTSGTMSVSPCSLKSQLHAAVADLNSFPSPCLDRAPRAPHRILQRTPPRTGPSGAAAAVWW